MDVEWARGILTDAEISQFYSNIADLQKLKFKFPKAGDGSYIFETDNSFILTNGDWTKPVIKFVISFDKNTDYNLSYLKRTFYEEFKTIRYDSAGQQLQTACDIFGCAFGDGVVSFGAIENSEKIYGRQDGRGEGTNSRKTDSGASGNGKNRVTEDDSDTRSALSNTEVLGTPAEPFVFTRGNTAYDNAMLCLDYLLDNPEVDEYKDYARKQRQSARREGYDVFGETVDGERLTDVENGGIIDNIETNIHRSPQNYWHTGLSNKDVSIIEEWVQRAGKPPANRIVKNSYWYKGRFEGEELFVIYSTENPKGYVISHLSIGEDADIELNSLLEFLEEIKNGKTSRSVGGKKASDTISGGDWMQNQHDLENNDDGLRGRNSGAENASVYQRASSKLVGSTNFKNVVRDLFEREERLAREQSYRSALSDTEVLSETDASRKTLHTDIYSSSPKHRKGDRKLDSKSLNPHRPRLQPRLGYCLPPALAGWQKLRNAEGRSAG